MKRQLLEVPTQARVWQDYFYNDKTKKLQWAALVKKTKKHQELSLETVCQCIEAYLLPILNKIHS